MLREAWIRGSGEWSLQRFSRSGLNLNVLNSLFSNFTFGARSPALEAAYH